jgi:hypothetical protein
VLQITEQLGGMEDATSMPSSRPGGRSRAWPPGHFHSRSFAMKFLNHLVAARLMKDAETFERIGEQAAVAFHGRRRLAPPSGTGAVTARSSASSSQHLSSCSGPNSKTWQD